MTLDCGQFDGKRRKKEERTGAVGDGNLEAIGWLSISRRLQPKAPKASEVRSLPTGIEAVRDVWFSDVTPDCRIGYLQSGMLYKSDGWIRV